MDTKKRSWAKSLVWRLIGVVLLGLISFLVTDNWKEMSIITALFHSIRVVLYYYHERGWERISWGRAKHPLAGLPVKQQLTPEDMETVREHLKELGYVD